MVFDPKISAEFSFERPTETPTAIGVLESLFSFGVSNLGKSKTSGSGSLTAPEKFAVDFSEYVNNQPPSWKLDSKSMRDFIRTHPQHTNEMTSYAESLGVVTKPFVEEARDTGVEEFLKTPEGVLAANKAAAAGSAEESNAIILGAMTEKANLDASIAAAEREKKAGETQDSITARNWDLIGDHQRRFANDVVSEVLSPLLTSVMAGNTVSLTPEQAAQLGVTYTDVNMGNLMAVLLDTRNSLANHNSSVFASQFGYSAGMPPKEWESRVLGGIDFLIEEAKQISSPQERANALSSIIESKVYEKLDEKGLAVASYVLKTFPPEVTREMFVNNPNLMTQIAEAIVNESGVIGSPQEIKDNVSSMSKKEAQDMVKKVVELGATGDPSFFAAFKEAQERSGYSIVDGPSWNSVIGKNVEQLKFNAESNPDFRKTFTDWLSGDINQTVEYINRQLPPEVEVTLQNDKFVLVPKTGFTDLYYDESAIQAMAGSGFEGNTEFLKRSRTKDALSKLDKQIGLDVLNQKFTSLKLLGSAGQEVFDAIGMQYAPVEVKGGGGDTKVKGGPANDTLSYDYTTSNGAIAQKLGIDFGAVEATYNLPAGFLERTAFIELRGNPSAKNPNSSAGGLFQQIDSNAKEWGVADRFDPMQSTEGAAKFAASNAAYLSKRLGREVTGAELYLAHQQGPGGALALLSDPNALAVDIVGEKAVTLNGGDANMTAGEFANIWISKYNGQRGATSYAPTQAVKSNFNPTGAVSKGTSEQAMASGAPERAATEPVGVQATPVAEKSDKAPQRLSDALSERAKEILATKPMDADVKALIEALIGGK